MLKWNNPSRYVQTSSLFRIDSNRIPYVIKALRELADSDHHFDDSRPVKDPKGKHFFKHSKIAYTLQKCFKHVSMDYLESNNVKEIFHYWGFQVNVDVGGNVDRIYYTDRTSRNNDVLFLNTIAPFVKPGSYIEVFNRDENCFEKWIFRNGEFEVEKGRVIYPKLNGILAFLGIESRF